MPARKHSAAKPFAAKQSALTTPDLVLLSLLAERPMHGYQANLELERRQVNDWAGVSRPQVYYSLEKLARAGFIRAVSVRSAPLRSPRGRPSAAHRGSIISAPPANAAAGPQRRVFAITPQGRRALAAALQREGWTTHRDHPAFLTWLALSWQASPSTFQRQLCRRRKFLQRQLGREQSTLRAVRKEVGHSHHEAVWMLNLVIAQLKIELRWLRAIVRSSRRRAPSRHSANPRPVN
jgi:DNA-binding PadR family transcriptional regulator